MDIKVMSISLSEGGLKKHDYTHECKETPSLYVVTKESGFGGKTTRLPKGDILKVMSNVRENLYHTLHVYAWYFPGDEKKVETLLMDNLKETATRQAKVAFKMLETVS